MANRRMFSKSITNSSNFLMMPQSAQALYLHLGMNADDDGYCEHFMVMRMTDSKPDDLKILNVKGFVEVFDEKVLIIRDWKENNYIQADRYTASKYLGVYNIDTKCIQDVYKTDTQVRLGKVRLGKDSIEGEGTPLTLRRFASKSSINEQILEEMSSTYEVPVEFVKDCWENAQNWLLANGKVKQDYRAFLTNWVKKEKASYLLKSRKFGGRSGVYDARE